MSGQNRRAGVITPAVRTPGAGSVLLLLHQRPKQSRARRRAERAPRGGLGSRRQRGSQDQGPRARSLSLPHVSASASSSRTPLPACSGAGPIVCHVGHHWSPAPASTCPVSISFHLEIYIYIYSLNLYMYLNSLPVILYQAENLQTSLFAARFPRQWSRHCRSYRM